MRKTVEKNTIKFELLALLGLFIPGALLPEDYDNTVDHWIVHSFNSYSSMINRSDFLITVFLIVLIIVIQILRLKIKKTTILHSKHLWVIDILPLIWYVITSYHIITVYNNYYGEGERLAPSIMLFLEIVILLVPIIRHKAWEKMSSLEAEDGDGVSKIILGVAIFLMIVCIVINVLEFGSSGTDASYYMDYNQNGQMDEGEHVYDEYSDGGSGYDYDGDGWNDYNSDGDE